MLPRTRHANVHTSHLNTDHTNPQLPLLKGGVRDDGIPGILIVVNPVTYKTPGNTCGEGIRRHRIHKLRDVGFTLFYLLLFKFTKTWPDRQDSPRRNTKSVSHPTPVRRLFHVYKGTRVPGKSYFPPTRFSIQRIDPYRTSVPPGIFEGPNR